MRDSLSGQFHIFLYLRVYSKHNLMQRCSRVNESKAPVASGSINASLLQLCSNDELCVAIVSEALCLSLRELGRRAVSKCHTCALS